MQHWDGGGEKYKDGGQDVRGCPRAKTIPPTTEIVKSLISNVLVLQTMYYNNKHM